MSDDAAGEMLRNIFGAPPEPGPPYVHTFSPVPPGPEEAVKWLREQIGARLYLAQRAIELGNAATWQELSSGVLVTGKPTADDTWHGTWPMGDSSLARLMEANDPQDTIARCEAELLILDEHPEHAGDPGHCARCQNWRYAIPAPWPCTTLRCAASAYRHRPGYARFWGDPVTHTITETGS